MPPEDRRSPSTDLVASFGDECLHVALGGLCGCSAPLGYIAFKPASGALSGPQWCSAAIQNYGSLGGLLRLLGRLVGARWAACWDSLGGLLGLVGRLVGGLTGE